VRQRRAPSLLPSRRRTVHFQWFLELGRSGGLFFASPPTFDTQSWDDLIRPYKRAFSQAEAISMMMTSPGHLDSQLLSAFVSKMVISGTLH
jgi:hypothetical protein